MIFHWTFIKSRKASSFFFPGCLKQERNHLTPKSVSTKYLLPDLEPGNLLGRLIYRQAQGQQKGVAAAWGRESDWRGPREWIGRYQQREQPWVFHLSVWLAFLHCFTSTKALHLPASDHLTLAFTDARIEKQEAKKTVFLFSLEIHLELSKHRLIWQRNILQIPQLPSQWPDCHWPNLPSLPSHGSFQRSKPVTIRHIHSSQARDQAHLGGALDKNCLRNWLNKRTGPPLRETRNILAASSGLCEMFPFLWYLL